VLKKEHKQPTSHAYGSVYVQKFQTNTFLKSPKCTEFNRKKRSENIDQFLCPKRDISQLPEDLTEKLKSNKEVLPQRCNAYSAQTRNVTHQERKSHQRCDVTATSVRHDSDLGVLSLPVTAQSKHRCSATGLIGVYIVHTLQF